MEINPIRASEVVKVNQTSSKEDVVANKIAGLGLPSISQKGGLANRDVILLKEVQELSRYIKKEWNELETHELAETIITLKDKVSLLPPDMKGVKKIQRQVDRFHFQFVLPVALELDKNATIPSFARTIHALANKVLKQGSFDPSSLNEMQMREVTRYAKEGA
jgi:hypothetical protein